MIDNSPFQLLTEASQTEYQVNLSLEQPDGSIILALSNERRVAAERLIRPMQLYDLEQSWRTIESIRFGIVIENGTNTS